MLRAPKPASTQGGATDVAFVTQAATRTLQQRTVDLVMSASTAAGGDERHGATGLGRLTSAERPGR